MILYNFVNHGQMANYRIKEAEKTNPFKLQQFLTLSTLDVSKSQKKRTQTTLARKSKRNFFHFGIPGFTTAKFSVKLSQHNIGYKAQYHKLKCI